ncbi:hypothetical protein BSKO_00991 [Bryopsis sp. KO-2023]|nr:hypothetical protein BSKO_00991 [Bryopsis sp. KO-2023]
MCSWSGAANDRFGTRLPTGAATSLRFRCSKSLSLSRVRSQRKPRATSGPQFPPYTVVYDGPQYSLRMYDPYPVVRMSYQRRDEAFLALGTYFDGRNEGSIRFKETQPAIMTHAPEGTKTMELFVGDSKDGKGSSKPPLPGHPELYLAAGGGELVAVQQFEGNITPPEAQAVRQKLISALQKDGVQLAENEENGGFRVAQYGALFSLGRLNELMLKVKL